MTFRKVDLIFVVLALLVVGGVALLPSARPQSRRCRQQRAPGDHGGQSVCDLSCTPRVRLCRCKHPKRQDCLHCHARAGREA